MSMPDNNYEGVADNMRPVSISQRTIQPHAPQYWDDVLKLSNAWAVTVTDCDINPEGGNREDGIDINRFSRECIIKDCRVRAGGKYAVTVKGGSNYITLKNIVIHGPRGKEGVDIDIGNYANNIYAMTHNIYIYNVNREDGRPVRIRIGRGCDVHVRDSNVKILVFQSIMLKAYVWAKFNLVRLINKIKGLIK